jgi:hypothetical protein
VAVALKTRDGRTIAVPAWQILIALSVVALVPLLGLLGTNVFLRPSVIGRFPLIFAGASLAAAVALLPWVLRKGFTPAHASGPLARRVFQLAVSLAVAGLAAGAVATFASLLVLHQQVRAAGGTPVEFTTRIVHVGQARGCITTLTFTNEPLQTESSVCADAFAIRNARPGEPIVVREAVGALGGRVTSIRSAQPPR